MSSQLMTAQIYNATKAYISHLGKSLAREWRDFARVNMVSPGFFNTAMGASGLVRKDDAAGPPGRDKRDQRLVPLSGERRVELSDWE
jgi:NAD(P)-dependent dehydrogenase (short-subunit alcohol dehydrogenase family)